MEIRNAKCYKAELINLLKEAGLPYEDLPETPKHFVVAMVNNEVVGAAGLEVYDDSALLRSVVVSPAYQRQGFAERLLNTLIEKAVTENIKQLLLLTETAADYFAKKGFQPINRGEVPEAVKASSEFSHVCPASAIVMSKSLIT